MKSTRVHTNVYIYINVCTHCKCRDVYSCRQPVDQPVLSSVRQGALHCVMSEKVSLE